MFEYHDSEAGLTQRFVFNLRYYLGREGNDGLYEFAVDGVQKSHPYGAINLRRLQRRENTNSSEFVLIWEQQVKNETIRASARININKFDPYVKYDVELNSVPVKTDKSGKDIVVDWYFLDGFDTGNKFWVDANGMQMIEKNLYARREFTYRTSNTVSANYYPVTTAIAVRDTNSTSRNFTEKQVVILNDRAQGGSAGLRDRRNIELMQQRRGRKYDHYGVFEPLNDLDEWGKGIQVPASYYMLIEDKASPANQRQVQKKLEQPLLFFYSHDFRLNNAAGNPTQNSSLAQGSVQAYNASRTGPLVNYGAQDELFLLAVGAEKHSQTFDPSTSPNYLSTGNTFKAVVFAIAENEIQVRVNNLEDRFDDNPLTYVFDAKKYAREYYYEANAHLFGQLKARRAMALMDKLRVSITEMNLAGSVPREEMLRKGEFTKWRTPPGTELGLEPPQDHLFEEAPPSAGPPSPGSRASVSSNSTAPTGHNYSLEPQRIRVFHIKYLVGDEMNISFAIRDAKKAAAAAAAP